MKTLIIIIAALLIGLSGCKKEEEVICWECTTVSTSWSNNSTQRNTWCGITETEARIYESDNTWQTSEAKVSTSCIRK